ncbi:hypothetical protein [Novosphingobium sp.]|uniref:hypothetical protein n=1 Tax=Novosphingobium sp. TaxID=1874826 RepID=UPI002622DABC|nr:hypothetical protein [Novosphingobium sp.]
MTGQAQDLCEPPTPETCVKAEALEQAFDGGAPDIEIVQDWIPTDPARSIEAILIAVFLVCGWLLALWVYASLLS